jgi:hypothetical protein
MLAAAALLALASGWILPGEHLLVARQYDGEQQTLYGPATLHDVDDAPLELWVTVKPRTITANATVHGVPAELGDLTDEGEAYGREVAWTESGLTFSLGLDGKPADARMLALAESIQPVSAERWHTLRVATGPTRLSKRMKRVRVQHGLTVRLPEGFPVAPEDRRPACLELRHRGQRRTVCDEPAAWRRIGGTVFVFGQLPARVKRVSVAGRSTPTRRARGYPLSRFYAVALPTDTCTVTVRGAGLGLRTGPAAGGPEADRRRCLGKG